MLSAAPSKATLRLVLFSGIAPGEDPRTAPRRDTLSRHCVKGEMVQALGQEYKSVRSAQIQALYTEIAVERVHDRLSSARSDLPRLTVLT